MAYRRRGRANLHPADAALNLPQEKHSHGLRQLAAVEACRDSFDGAVAAPERATGQRLGKRQVEDLARRAATDFAGFYTDRAPPEADPADVLVVSADGKGIVMRPAALREPTAKAAAEQQHKLKTRLSKGEKGNRKRMATVAAVYDAAPAPVARGKWLDASVEDDAAAVIADAFDEAERRDPNHARTWIALARGWPIATGVIEGACRHLVKDRLARTGARWSVEGAEAVLKLRAIISNGDWHNYWRWHLDKEHQRIHASRYANNQIPHAA